MRLGVLQACFPVVAAMSLAATGCNKVKSALEDAAGFSTVPQSEVDATLAEVGWDADNENFEVVKNGAFDLTEKFPADLATEQRIKLPLDIPDKGKNAAGNQRSYALVQVRDIKIDDKTTYKRLRIVSIASFDGETSELVISGDKINQYIDDKDQISKKNDNQKGRYIMIQGKGDKGLAYLTGTVTLKKADSSSTNVHDATIFTTTSPFVTITGADGKYLLAIIEGTKGTVVAYDGTIVADYSAPGTPTSASKEVGYAGLLDQYKEGVLAKAGKVSADAKDKADSKFDFVNGKVTDFFNGWKLIQSDLMFIQPPQKAPEPPATPTTPPADNKGPVPTPPAPKDDAKPADPTPPADSVIVRRDPATPATYNVDLGCAGVNNDGVALDFVRDGTEMDDYTAHPGWRATGDVQYSWDLADVIFPKPASANYIDKVDGYCLLSTGDAMATITDDTAYTPGPDGAGQTSEMWQKLHVPADVKSIQVRVAFFSQEFPTYVGTAFNDSFFVKFDESPNFIAAGNLNDLAGAKDADNKDTVAACSGLDGSDKTKNCGEWMFVGGKTGMHGELGFINYSTTAPAQGEKFGCLSKDTTATTKCYHGMIEPRIICKDLDTQDVGQDRTLRFSVSDAGDAYFDSALAVDAVVFSKDACATPAGRMTDEKDSRAAAVGK